MFLVKNFNYIANLLKLNIIKNYNLSFLNFLNIISNK